MGRPSPRPFLFAQSLSPPLFFCLGARAVRDLFFFRFALFWFPFSRLPRVASAEVVVVGRFALPHDAERVDHPLAHATPTASACAACGEARVIAHDPVCFSDGRERAAYAFGVTRCLACGSLQPGAWARRPGDDQWTDATDSARLADARGDDAGGVDRGSGALCAHTTCHLCVREIEWGRGAGRPLVVPVEAREIEIALALAPTVGGGGCKGVSWTKVVRHRPWVWYFV